MSNALSPSDIIAILRDMEQRSRQGASKLSQQDSHHGVWTAIGFRVAQQHFLIPLNETREVFPVPAHITPVPKSEPWVFGIANLRGELLPLFDLKYFLSGHATKVNKRSRIVVINHPDLYSGLLIDEVFGLKHFQQQPEHVDSTETPYITGHISQHYINWDVFSFHKLTADLRFLHAAA